MTDEKPIPQDSPAPLALLTYDRVAAGIRDAVLNLVASEASTSSAPSQTPASADSPLDRLLDLAQVLADVDTTDADPATAAARLDAAIRAGESLPVRTEAIRLELAQRGAQAYRFNAVRSVLTGLDYRRLGADRLVATYAVTALQAGLFDLAEAAMSAVPRGTAPGELLADHIVLLRVCLWQTDAALTVLEEARREAPSDRLRWTLLEAFVRLSHGQTVAAAHSLQAALAECPPAGPQRFQAALWLGSVRRTQGDLAGALALFEQARTAYEHWMPMFERAMTLRFLGRIEEAASVAREASERHTQPDNPCPVLCALLAMPASVEPADCLARADSSPYPWLRYEAWLRLQAALACCRTDQPERGQAAMLRLLDGAAVERSRRDKLRHMIQAGPFEPSATLARTLAEGMFPNQPPDSYDRRALLLEFGLTG